MEVFNAVAPTTNYSDHQVVVPRPQWARGTTGLWVNYTKGTETSISIQIELSNSEDTEDWHKAGQVDNSGNVTLVPDYTFTATGKYRIEVPTTREMNEVRVSVKRTGAGAGTVTVYAE